MQALAGVLNIRVAGSRASKILSTFSWVRMWGGSVATAYMLQAAVTLAVKAAALCLSAMLASPYGYDYDMMIVAPAIAFLASDCLVHGWRPWEKTTLAAALAGAQ